MHAFILFLILILLVWCRIAYSMKDSMKESFTAEEEKMFTLKLFETYVETVGLKQTLDPYLQKDANGNNIRTPIDDETFKYTFKLPKGDTGGLGPKGDKGDKGDQGQIGATGDKGDKGDKGVKGDQGPKGDTGANTFDFSKMMLNGDSFKQNNKEEKNNGPEPIASHSTLFS